MRFMIIGILLATIACRSALAQTAEEYTARGDSLHDAIAPGPALEQYKAALTLDPDNAEILWRAARSQVDLAKQIEGDHEYTTHVRDSVYSVARDYAERAVAADSLSADAHFAVGLVLGHLSRTRSGKERVTFAREIFHEGTRAVELEPAHDGAHHVLGAWHAEVKRLPGLTRFFARTFLGAGFLDQASWDASVRHLERAVELKPTYLFHRLELAEVLVDLERFADARAQLRAIPELPDQDVLDAEYRGRAARLLEEISDK